MNKYVAEFLGTIFFLYVILATGKPIPIGLALMAAILVLGKFSVLGEPTKSSINLRPPRPPKILKYFSLGAIAHFTKKTNVFLTENQK